MKSLLSYLVESMNSLEKLQKLANDSIKDIKGFVWKITTTKAPRYDKQFEALMLTDNNNGGNYMDASGKHYGPIFYIKNGSIVRELPIGHKNDYLEIPEDKIKDIIIYNTKIALLGRGKYDVNSSDKISTELNKGESLFLNEQINDKELYDWLKKCFL